MRDNKILNGGNNVTEKENKLYIILLTSIKCDKNAPKIYLKDNVIYSP